MHFFKNHKQHFSANVRQSCVFFCVFIVILWFQGVLSFWMKQSCVEIFFEGKTGSFLTSLCVFFESSHAFFDTVFAFFPGFS